MPKVLIVDDIRSEQQLIANALRPHGYQCLEASDGGQANLVEAVLDELVIVSGG